VSATHPPFVLSEVEGRAGAAPVSRTSTSLNANGGGAFADRATRLSGIAGALAGWRPDEFWRATPAELEAVLTALAGPGAEAASPPAAKTIAALKEQFPDG
jgi:Phage tail assembly chaperone protein, TAC